MPRMIKYVVLLRGIPSKNSTQAGSIHASTLCMVPESQSPLVCAVKSTLVRILPGKGSRSVRAHKSWLTSPRRAVTNRCGRNVRSKKAITVSFSPSPCNILFSLATQEYRVQRNRSMLSLGVIDDVVCSGRNIGSNMSDSIYKLR